MTAPEARVDLDDLPLSRFHLRTAALTFGAQASDGFSVGIIAMALVLIVREGAMELDVWWTGALGAGALLGLFVGSLVFGGIADRFGRRRIYRLTFVVVTLATLAQFWVQEPWQLFALRLVIGLGIGADYAVGTTLVTEVLPRRRRGEILASGAVVWTAGYVLATLLGLWFLGSGIPDAWRWMLVAPGLIAVVVLVARLGTPESPRWLLRQGREEEARRVLDRHFGAHVVLHPEAAASRGAFRELFGRRYLRRTVFNCVFYTCLVMPYFAIYTFLPLVLAQMGLSGLAGSGNATVEVALNVFLLLGAVTGIWFTARFSRRGFLLSALVVLTVALAALALAPAGATLLSVVLFAVFTFTLAAAGNLVGVLPAESFPTAIRSSGIGLTTAVSRVGSVASTFVLPVMLSGLGVPATMLALAGVLLVGLVVSWLWAPETKGKSLTESAAAPHDEEGTPSGDGMPSTVSAR